MFSQPWMAALTAVAAFALLGRRPLLFAAAMLALTASLAVAGWGRLAFRRLAFSRRLTPQRIFPGEVATLSLAVENHKRLPLPWLRLEEQVPEDVRFSQGLVKAHYLPRRARLVTAFQVGWYERVTHRYQLTVARRGCYTFGPARVTSGDLFGFQMVEREDLATTDLLVLPPVVPLERLGLPPGLPLGGVRSQRSLEADPAAIAGTRLYDPRDDFRDVHWYATARMGELQTKVYEPMVDQSIAVFLNAATVDPAWAGLNSYWLETAVTAAASVLADCSDRHVPTGLYSNGHVQGQGGNLRLPVGPAEVAFPAALEGLACMLAPPIVAFETLLAQEAPLLPMGATVVVITAVMTEGLQRALADAASRRTTLVLLVGGAEAPSLPGVLSHYVTWEGGAGDAVHVAAR